MKKTLLALLLTCSFGLTVFAEAPTELVMYLIGNSNAQYDAALAKFNEKAKADLNVTLKVNFIGWGDIWTKYPLVLASGEPIDLIYTSTWLNFTNQALKGAFKPLEKLGPQYAPISWKTEPAEGLRQATINGHIYALPPNYEAYSTFGPIVRGDLMKKYGITDIKNVDDYGKFLDAVAQKDKQLDPSGMSNTQPILAACFWYQKGLYPLSGDPNVESPFWINFQDKSGKLVNITDMPDTLDILKKLGDWSKKGYWPKSVLSNKDTNMFQNGKAASVLWNFDNWLGNYQQHPEWDVKFYTMLPKTFILPYMQDGMAIPASAQHPEKALQLLDKIRNDESYWRLLSYGIEGTHYEITKEGMIKPLDLTNFPPEQYCSWGFRDSRFRKDVVGYPSNAAAARAALKANAAENVYVSFNQNVEPVKNEYSAVLNVMQQYWVPLKLGYIEPEKGLKTLKEKLKAAGIDKVQAEFQKQVDAFLATRK
jgi:putative aldouronate transport system substrate-binding protein